MEAASEASPPAADAAAVPELEASSCAPLGRHRFVPSGSMWLLSSRREARASYWRRSGGGSGDSCCGGLHLPRRWRPYSPWWPFFSEENNDEHIYAVRASRAGCLIYFFLVSTRSCQKLRWPVALQLENCGTVRRSMQLAERARRQRTTELY